jgi:hypothetical protein
MELSATTTVELSVFDGRCVMWMQSNFVASSGSGFGCPQGSPITVGARKSALVMGVGLAIVVHSSVSPWWRRYSKREGGSLSRMFSRAVKERFPASLFESPVCISHFHVKAESRGKLIPLPMVANGKGGSKVEHQPKSQFCRIFLVAFLVCSVCFVFCSMMCCVAQQVKELDRIGGLLRLESLIVNSRGQQDLIL